jgi:hypothetical protein
MSACKFPEHHTAAAETSGLPWGLIIGLAAVAVAVVFIITHAWAVILATTAAAVIIPGMILVLHRFTIVAEDPRHLRTPARETDPAPGLRAVPDLPASSTLNTGGTDDPGQRTHTG